VEQSRADVRASALSERAKTILLGRLATPEDIAGMVVFLASDEAAYMTGQAVNVTGGLWLHWTRETKACPRRER